MPQYDESATGTLTLPSDPNRGLFASPQVNRGALGLSPTGIVIPQVDSDPTTGARPGMIVYNRATDQLRLYDGTTWKSILLDP